MQKSLLVVYLIVFSNFAFAQSAFNRHYTFGTWSKACQFVEIPGHAYYAVGYNDVYNLDSVGNYVGGYNTGLIVNIDYNGDTIKSYEIGVDDTIFNNSAFYVARKSNDGNIIVGGNMNDFNDQNMYDQDLCVVKFSPNLDTLWKKVFSLPDTGIFTYYSDMCMLINGGFALTGMQRVYILMVSNYWFKRPYNSSTHSNFITDYSLRFNSERHKYRNNM